MIDVCIKNIVTNEKKFNKSGNFFFNSKIQGYCLPLNFFLIFKRLTC